MYISTEGTLYRDNVFENMYVIKPTFWGRRRADLNRVAAKRSSANRRMTMESEKNVVTSYLNIAHA